MDLEIIDFHTHPFIEDDNNICKHKENLKMSPDYTKEVFGQLGVSKICGSVIEGKGHHFDSTWERLKHNNDIALSLRDHYGDFYIPGFHVHPAFIEESIAEIHRMHKADVRLIGELVPYCDGWKDYSCEGFSVILDEAEKYDMIVNFHSSGDDEMDAMVKAHPNVTFVAAHPGEYAALMRHIDRMRMSDNYYLDLSGTGIFRYGAVRHLIDEVGSERLLFGSDYPTCAPGMYVGAILFDNTLTDTEKEMILAGNAKRLLRI
ncbi:MAG: amidohydrolase [Clostridia bacterium]|nr:amidohydrolase [Clostridia bacterium]